MKLRINFKDSNIFLKTLIKKHFLLHLIATVPNDFRANEMRLDVSAQMMLLFELSFYYNSIRPTWLFLNFG